MLDVVCFCRSRCPAGTRQLTSVHEPLDAFGQHLGDEERGTRDTYAREHVIGTYAPPCRALSTDSDPAPGQHSIQQVHQRRGLGQHEFGGASWQREPSGLAGKPQGDVRATGEPDGGDRESLRASLRRV